MVLQSFIPDAATALAIQVCVSNKTCLMKELDVSSLSTGITAGVDLAISLDVSLSASGPSSPPGVDTLLIAAVTEAFSIAGETLPPLPPPPAVPDMSASASAAADLSVAVSAIVDPLGALGGVIDITFDVTGLPTLIEWDDGM
jgi:hypothetical protein